MGGMGETPASKTANLGKRKGPLVGSQGPETGKNGERGVGGEKLGGVSRSPKEANSRGEKHPKKV